MATGDTTLTNLGTYSLSSAALKTKIDAQNVGAATAGTETDTLHFIPAGEGQVNVVKVARAA